MNTTASSYIVLGTKSWNKTIFDRVISHYPGRWYYFARREQLTNEALVKIKPTHLFFLHWSWIVPPTITDSYDCICFHMTDVPFGRGGSPLQNLIKKGYSNTVLTALRMTQDVDAGPVYLKEKMSLSGTAEHVYIRSTYLAAKMIKTIITASLVPVPQQGTVVSFSRRTPEQSTIPEVPTSEALYDFIRMLDAEGYPHAFLEHKQFRYEFCKANLSHDGVIAKVIIRPLKEKNG